MAGRRTVETLVVMQPIAVDTGSPDHEGRLVIANGLLVAVLVRLEAPEHDEIGGWFLEVGFGRLKGLRAPTFLTLDAATRWLRGELRP